MNNFLVSLFVLVLVLIDLNGQDRINTYSGNVYECFISKIDSCQIEYFFELNGKDIRSSILTDSVMSIFYDNELYPINILSSQKINSITKDYSFNINSPVFQDNSRNWPIDFVYSFDGEVLSGRKVEYQRNKYYKSGILLVDKVPSRILIGNVAFYMRRFTTSYYFLGIQ